MTELSRRGFLHGTLVTLGALTLDVSCGSGSAPWRIRHADETGELVANLYVTIMPSGRVELVVNKAEIGQGVSTGYATLVAEELNIPIDRVDVHYADSHPEMRSRTNMQITGGSSSTTEAFVALRRAAAAAREMMVTAAATAWNVPATDCVVADGHVRYGDRSAGYGELTSRAARVPVPDHPRIKSKTEFVMIGKVNRRVDARAKVDGTAVFGIDVRVPGMVNAYVIHGPKFGARPLRIVADGALRRPGVISIFAIDRGVAIVAEKYWQARAAAVEVAVTWDDGDVAGLDTEELQAAMRADHDHGALVVAEGNVRKAIRRADTTVSAQYEAPYVAHAPLEPQNCTVRVAGRSVEVWAPTQSPSIVQEFVAHAIGVDRDDVVVHVTLSGGSFGRRVVPDVAAEAAVIAKRVKRPVKLVWSRESDMRQGFYRPVYSVKMTGSLHGGRATGAQVYCLSQSISLALRDVMGAAVPGIPHALKAMFLDSLMAMFATNTLDDLYATEGLKDTPYRFDNYELSSAPVQTRLPVANWRSVGNSVTGFAMESFIDELAIAARRDPFEFRKQLLAPGSRQVRALDALEQLSGWRSPAPQGLGRGVARHFSFNTEVAEVAEVEIVSGRIRVRRVYCVVDCGLAINPDLVRAQMEGAIIFGLSAALDQQITLVDGAVQEANFDRFPVLRMHEAPEIIVQILDNERYLGGAGEPALPPIAAAVANAVFALTNVRLRRMPLQRAWNERGAV